MSDTPAAGFATPLSIVTAGALIAIAVYLGLRSQAPAQPSSMPFPATSAGGASAPAAPASPSAASNDEVARQTAAALEAFRAPLAKRCWAPFAKSNPNVKNARWEFNFTFGADGQQIIRGVADLSDGGAVDATTCVLENIPPLTIPPPHATIRVEVPFALP